MGTEGNKLSFLFCFVFVLLFSKNNSYSPLLWMEKSGRILQDSTFFLGGPEPNFHRRGNTGPEEWDRENCYENALSSVHNVEGQGVLLPGLPTWKLPLWLPTWSTFPTVPLSQWEEQ